MAKPTETPFGMLTCVDPMNNVLDGGTDPPPTEEKIQCRDYPAFH